MAEQLQELLERINREGVEKAEKKAAEIVDAAEKKAKEIVEAAEKRAAAREAAAEAAAGQLKENAEKAIAQSARNVLLSLEEEIGKYFDRILTAEIGESLTPEALTAAILNLVEKAAARIGGDENVEVTLAPDDAKKIADHLLARFKQDAGEKLTINPVPSVEAGFTISFDGGKSSYDFTDNGLRELLSTYLSPHLKEIISR
jgi:V/A-type H+/Na+-transporting ATPase subunit E